MLDIMILLLQALRFYSRLPIPVLPWESNPHAPPDFRTLPLALPLAGCLLGMIGAAILLLAMAINLGPVLAALLCIAVMTWATGAFHEDGLADMADGFGGGATKERRLEIMKDSRIGSFGACALMLVLALRVAALAVLIERTGAYPAALAFIGASSLSRALGLIPLAFLEPARTAGFSAAVGQPGRVMSCAMVAAACLILLVLLNFAAISSFAGAFAVLGSILPVLYLTYLSHHLIEGQTGDVAGASQQLAEAFCMIGLIAGLSVKF